MPEQRDIKINITTGLPPMSDEEAKAYQQYLEEGARNVQAAKKKCYRFADEVANDSFYATQRAEKLDNMPITTVGEAKAFIDAVVDGENKQS